MAIRIALLRGINVGGNKKVPMADLKAAMNKAGFKEVQTLLNSGNVIFDTGKNKGTETELERLLESTFGFQVPTIIRSKESVQQLLKNDPFANIEMNKDLRRYITFLRSKPKQTIKTPWISDDGAYRILEVTDSHIVSLLDVSVSKTTKAMDQLEIFFGKDVTTRNWNTILKIGDKL